MAPRELERDVASVAAPDDDGRRGFQRIEQGRRVVRFLLACRLEERLRPLAARVSAPVVEDHSTEPGQRLDGGGPHERGAAAAVDPEDRSAFAVLLVVEPDPVGDHLGHPRLARCSRTARETPLSSTSPTSSNSTPSTSAPLRASSLTSTSCGFA